MQVWKNLHAPFIMNCWINDAPSPDIQSADIFSLSGRVLRMLSMGYKGHGTRFGGATASELTAVLSQLPVIFPLFASIYNLKNLPERMNHKKKEKNVPNSTILVTLPRSWHLVTTGYHSTNSPR